MAGKSYRDLVAWQKAIVLVEEVYRATSQFPKLEIYSLTNQVRRAVVSVLSNITEGQGRTTVNEFRHFLSISYGSLYEVETYVIIAGRLHYLNQEQITCLLKLSSEVGRLINGLRRSLQ